MLPDQPITFHLSLVACSSTANLVVASNSVFRWLIIVIISLPKIVQTRHNLVEVAEALISGAVGGVVDSDRDVDDSMELHHQILLVLPKHDPTLLVLHQRTLPPAIAAFSFRSPTAFGVGRATTRWSLSSLPASAFVVLGDGLRQENPILISRFLHFSGVLCFVNL